MGNGELAGIYACEFWQTYPREQYKSPGLSITFNGKLTQLLCISVFKCEIWIWRSKCQPYILSRVCVDFLAGNSYWTYWEVELWLSSKSTSANWLAPVNNLLSRTCATGQPCCSKYLNVHRPIWLDQAVKPALHKNMNLSRLPLNFFKIRLSKSRAFQIKLLQILYCCRYFAALILIRSLVRTTYPGDKQPSLKDLANDGSAANCIWA